MIRTKIISSLENVFADEDFNKYPEVRHLSALRGERISVQMLYTYTKDDSEIYTMRELSPE